MKCMNVIAAAAFCALAAGQAAAQTPAPAQPAQPAGPAAAGKAHALHSFDHQGAHTVCAAQAANHEAHKKCLHDHHVKSAHPSHRSHIADAFKTCQNEKDHDKHQHCIEDHMHKKGVGHPVGAHKRAVAQKAPLHRFNHQAAHSACGAHSKDHEAHKKCLHDHHVKAAHPSHRSHIADAFKSCHGEKDLAKHQQCIDSHLHKVGVGHPPAPAAGPAKKS